MATVSVERTINAPIGKVWASWDDFANIARFNPNVTGSRLINNSAPTGLNAQRQCDLSDDGKQYIRERIIGYQPQRQLVVDVYEATVPIKRAKGTIDFQDVGPNQTRIRFTMDFTPKMGPIGILMLPLMKSQFKKMLGKLLDGNRSYVVRPVAMAA